jgi:hypothetical protein
MSDSFDEQISALYRKSSQDVPPSHLDDAILALAKQEAQSTPDDQPQTKAMPPFGGKWTLPFSLAAVIVLSVSLITLVEKESPPTPADSLGTLIAPQEAQEAAPQPLVKDEALEEERAPAAAEMTDKLAEKTLSKTMPKTMAKKKRASSPAPRLVLKNQTPEKAVAGAAVAASASEPAPADIEADTASRQTKPETTQTAGVKAREKQTRKSEPSDKASMAGPAANLTPSQTEPQTKRAPRVEPPSSASAPQPKPSAPSSAFALSARRNQAQHCQASTAKQCLQSQQCTYVLTEPGRQYQCREAANRCEQNFIQLGSTGVNSGKASCESKPGCRFIPGNCQCPEGEKCDCHGKNPPQCAP